MGRKKLSEEEKEKSRIRKNELCKTKNKELYQNDEAYREKVKLNSREEYKKIRELKEKHKFFELYHKYIS